MIKMTEEVRSGSRITKKGIRRMIDEKKNEDIDRAIEKTEVAAAVVIVVVVTVTISTAVATGVGIIIRNQKRTTKDVIEFNFVLPL